MADYVDLQNFNTGRGNGRLPKKRYNAMRRALLKVIPRGAAGVPYGQLKRLVPPLLPQWWKDEGWSIGWHITVVKLDLEARGEIERIAGRRPMQLRRCRRAR